VLIDWFTVGAQAINFIVLVWLMKRFLYKPVLSAIDAREKRIAAELADADRRKNELQQSRDELAAKRLAFDDACKALFAKATVDANTERERLLGNARKEADALLTQRQTTIQNDTAALSHELARLATAESINMARAALRDLAGADLEERISEVFVRRLREMDPGTKACMSIALKASTGVPLVRSSFDLSEREKIAIRTALNETFSADIRLRFETSSTGIAGIELSAEGQRVSWTIEDFLKTLEEKVGALLRAGCSSGDISSGRTSAALPAAAVMPGASVPVPNRDAPAAAA
jgi:F-type H+-transporting ATPase subunit b